MIGSSRDSHDHHSQQSLNKQQHQHLVNHRHSNANQQHHDDDDDYQDDHGMRVGTNYQAEIPQFIAYSPAPEYYEDEKAIRVWSPWNKIPDNVLDEFINKAKDKYFYNTEQALGMLSWHKFDLNRAYADLPNFVPYPNEWSVEDKVLFEQAFQFHEKQFGRIKQMLPDKSMANLIHYYYTWKKTRGRASLMERQTRRFAPKGAKTAYCNDSDEGEADSNEVDANKPESGDGPNTNDAEEDRANRKDCSCEEKGIEEPEVFCCMCNKHLREHGENQHIIIDGVIDNFCSTCIVRKFKGEKNETEPENGDCFYHPHGERKRILFSYADVVSLVEGIPEAGDIMLKHLDSQVQDVKRAIQTEKQKLSQINEKIQPIADQVADLNMDEFQDILPDYKPSKVWTQDEIQLLIQGFRRYGSDFSAISDVLRTKAPETIKSFYVTQKERLGLATLVREYEMSKQSASTAQK